jgi:hypothetical protein
MKKARATLAVSLLAAAALVAGCGSSGSSTDARALIDKAFKQSISSADVTLNIQAKVNGVASLSQPISFKVAGPYQSNGKGKLPSFNWQISIAGGGQAFSGGLLSTGDNAFVNFQGTNYEIGTASIAKINQQRTQTGGAKSLKDFGIDPQAWVKDPQNKGDGNVNGVDTTHVQATVDVGRMFTDFNKTIAKAGGAMGTTATPRQLTPSQLSTIEQVVKSPKFDIYVGKSDSKIRRLAVSVDFQIPASQQAKFKGAQGGTLTFSIDFANVGKPQTITAPANARPISELQQQLGGITGGLGGLGGSGASGGSGAGSGGSGGSGSGGSGTGGTKTPTPAQFAAYSKCLQAANPSDTAAIQKCAQLLK